MKPSSTTIAITIVLAGISAFFFALVKSSSVTNNSPASTGGLETRLPMAQETQKPRPQFTAPTPERPGLRLQLDSKSSRKDLEDRVWNYLMDDQEFRKLFGVSRVKCSDTQCVASISLNEASWEDLQSYVKARPDFVSASIVYSSGKSHFEIQTKKFH